QRFERRVDPELAGFAWRRAAVLLCRVGAEQGDRPVVRGAPRDAFPGKRAVHAIRVRLPRVRAITGVALTETACSEALERLGFAVELPSTTELDVTPTSARADVTREVDVIEEILRVTGYDQVPSTLPVLRATPTVRPVDKADLARHALAAAGLAEAITY